MIISNKKSLLFTLILGFGMISHQQSQANLTDLAAAGAKISVSAVLGSFSFLCGLGALMNGTDLPKHLDDGKRSMTLSPDPKDPSKTITTYHQTPIKKDNKRALGFAAASATLAGLALKLIKS